MIYSNTCTFTSISNNIIYPKQLYFDAMVILKLELIMLTHKNYVRKLIRNTVFACT